MIAKWQIFAVVTIVFGTTTEFKATQDQYVQISQHLLKNETQNNIRFSYLMTWIMYGLESVIKPCLSL